MNRPIFLSKDYKMGLAKTKTIIQIEPLSVEPINRPTSILHNLREAL